MDKFKKFMSDETQIITDATEEINVIDGSFDEDTFIMDEATLSTKAIVKFFQPVSKNVTHGIMDAIKKGEMCIINLDKISSEEAQVIYNTLVGAIYSMDGTLKRIDDKIILCAPNNFIVDSAISDEL